MGRSVPENPSKTRPDLTEKRRWIAAKERKERKGKDFGDNHALTQRVSV